MEARDDRRSRLREAYRQLERAELYVVAARELVGADTEAGLAVERLRADLVNLGEDLREERREQPVRPQSLRAIGN
jgi:hypothetical protein